MNTDSIKTIISDYLTIENTHYAILINGTWGCGKTYFWKNNLTKIVEEKGFKPIYISLNGISRMDALEHLLFLKLVPFIGNQENKTLKAATTIVTNIANLLGKNLFKTTLTDVFKDLSVDAFNFSKYVICFDDLERCQIPIKEVLGFINNFVEHKSLKTIILSDEKNIDVTQTGYDNIKEKVVGRILNFELNTIETLPLLFEKYKTKNTALYNFFEKNMPYITDILIEYKQDNLRTISFYLEILERIFPALHEIEEKYIHEIILFAALITIEFKKGNLKSSDSSNPKGIDCIDARYYSLNIARTIMETRSENEKKDKLSYDREFYEKYLFSRINEYYYYPSIYSFILSGYIKLSDLEAEIKKRYPEEISQEIHDFRIILNYNFRELSNSEFKIITDRVLGFAEKGKYSIYDYVQISNFFYFFANNKLISYSVEEINKVLLAGLEIAKQRKEINDRDLENLLHFSDENVEVTKMKNEVKRVHFEIKKEQYFSQSKEFIESLTNNDVFALTAVFDKHKFSKELFQYIDEKILFESITRISNKQIFHLADLLKDRYASTNIGEFLFEDYTCLSALRDRIEVFLTKATDLQQPNKFLLVTLLDTLNEVCKHLDNSKKK